MFTAMLAVRNILGENHDVWSVNADCEYHEEIREVLDVRFSAMGCDSDRSLLSEGKSGGRHSDVDY